MFSFPRERIALIQLCSACKRSLCVKYTETLLNSKREPLLIYDILYEHLLSLCIYLSFLGKVPKNIHSARDGFEQPSLGDSVERLNH